MSHALARQAQDETMRRCDPPASPAEVQSLRRRPPQGISDASAGPRRCGANCGSALDASASRPQGAPGSNRTRRAPEAARAGAEGERGAGRRARRGPGRARRRGGRDAPAAGATSDALAAAEAARRRVVECRLCECSGLAEARPFFESRGGPRVRKACIASAGDARVPGTSSETEFIVRVLPIFWLASRR